MSRHQIAWVAVAAICTMPCATAAQPARTFLQYLDYAVKAAIARVIEKGIDSVWGTKNDEVREIKEELARLRREIERLPRPGGNRGVACSDRVADQYVRCLVDAIRAARERGQIDDKRAEALVGALLEALSVGYRHPSGPVGPLPGMVPAPPAGSSSGGDRAESRAVGVNQYCTRTTRSDGSTAVGYIRNGGRDGDWVEWSSRQDTATLVIYRNGKVESRQALTKRPLRPDRKRQFSRRIMYTGIGASNLAHGLGLTVYYGKADPREVTIYFGRFHEGQRHGAGCYFGSLSVFPYCYKLDIRVGVPERNGRIELPLCDGKR